ncbi:serine/threonine protein kinase, partial [Scheffersomyces stipitis CBS 6054]
MNNSPTSSFPEDEYRQYELGLHLLADRYHFVSKIQDGSFGKVSLALDSHSNSKVSIKAISKVNESSSKSSREIAYNEIRILEMLNTTASSKSDFDNSSVCKLLDSFEISNYVILVLEYCSKGDLYDLIHERTMTISEILRLAKQLYNAVGFSHSMNIFHRDIKPENILIDEHDNFKLCDWGLATTIRENDEFNVGTEKYMAPECFLTNASGQYIVSKYDCKYSDYWSFGVTLITSIFGTSPFKPTKNSESIQSDSNFRNFVNYNNPHVLYDIYSSMNTNCFQLFMSLLKVGNDEDDLATFSSKARSRNLSKFIRDLESNWIYGFTIDDEDKFYDINSKESDEAVFDMDHDDLELMKQSVTTITSDEEYDCNNMNNNNLKGISSSQGNTDEDDEDYDNFDLKMPSLVDSSIKSAKSWCDLDDEEGFD